MSMEIVFILVEPQVPENIGAAARALKTMGFSQLRLVNTCNHEDPAAGWVAHGSREILEDAVVYASIVDAVADCQLVIGTSAKLRSGFRELLTPKGLSEQLLAQQALHDRVAIVFGREDRGLSNDELDVCQQISSIPLVNAYPSLNLGQAVMLYAYELSSVEVEEKHQKPAKNETEQQAKMIQRVERILDQLSYPKDSPLALWAQEKLARTDADSVRFLHALCAAIEQQSR